MHGIGPGLAILIILALIGNTDAAWLWFDSIAYTLYWRKYLGVLLGLSGIAFGLGLVHCLAAQIVAFTIRLLRSGFQAGGG